MHIILKTCYGMPGSVKRLKGSKLKAKMTTDK